MIDLTNADSKQLEINNEIIKKNRLINIKA